MGFVIEGADDRSVAAAARLIGIHDTVGTLTRGRQADLVILDGNPLKQIEILRDRSKIMGVMQAGKFVAGPLAMA